jgi:hypothetical protein
VFPTIAAPGDQGISPIGRGGHLPKREDRGNPYQGSPAHWEGYYSSPSQGKGYFELYYFVGDLITLGWKNLLKSNTKGVRTVGMAGYRQSRYCNPTERCKSLDSTEPNQSGKKPCRGNRIGSLELTDRPWRRDMGDERSPRIEPKRCGAAVRPNWTRTRGSEQLSRVNRSVTKCRFVRCRRRGRIVPCLIIAAAVRQSGDALMGGGNLFGAECKVGRGPRRPVSAARGLLKGEGPGEELVENQ